MWNVLNNFLGPGATASNNCWRSYCIFHQGKVRMKEKPVLWNNFLLMSRKVFSYKQSLLNLYLYSIILFQRLFPVLTCSGYWAQPQIHLCQTWFIFHFRYFSPRWELCKGYIPVSSFKQFLESLAGSFTCVEGLVKIQFGLLISKAPPTTPIQCQMSQNLDNILSRETVNILPLTPKVEI